MLRSYIYFYIYIFALHEKREKNYDILSICEISSCTDTFGRFPFEPTLHACTHTHRETHSNCTVYISHLLPIVGAGCVCDCHDYDSMFSAHVVFIRQEVSAHSFISLIIIFQFRNVRLLFTYLQQVHWRVFFFTAKRFNQKSKWDSARAKKRQNELKEKKRIKINERNRDEMRWDELNPHKLQ